MRIPTRVAVRILPTRNRLRIEWFKLRVRVLCELLRSEVTLSIDPSVTFGKSVVPEIGPKTKSSVTIGPRSTIADDVRLRLLGGSIDIGEKVDVRAGGILNVGSGGELTIHGPSNIGWGVAIHCAERVTIEKFAQVAEYTTIVDSNHYFTDPDTWSYYNSRSAPIYIEQDVWICPKCTIASGVRLGHHSLIAPSSVVTKDMPANSLVSGSPAKAVRQMDHPWLVEEARAAFSEG